MNHWDDLEAILRETPGAVRRCCACNTIAQQAYYLGKGGKRYCIECSDMVIQCSVCKENDYAPLYSGPHDKFICEDCVEAAEIRKLQANNTLVVSLDEAITIFKRAFPENDRNRGIEYFREFWGLSKKVSVISMLDHVAKMSNGRTMASVNYINNLYDGEKAINAIINVFIDQGLKCYEARYIDKANKNDGMTYTVCHYDELVKNSPMVIGFKSDIVADPYAVI